MAKILHIYLLFVIGFAYCNAAAVDFTKDFMAKVSANDGNKKLKRSIGELNTAWNELFPDGDPLNSSSLPGDRDALQGLPSWKAHLLVRNPNFLRYLQEKRADYIPRLGRRSGSSQEKEDKVEFYTPRLGRSYSGCNRYFQKTLGRWWCNMADNGCPHHNGTWISLAAYAALIV